MTEINYRYFKVINAIRKDDKYILSTHDILGPNNRYKLKINSDQMPIEIARKVTNILYQKTKNKVFDWIVIRETTRNYPNRLYFYKSLIVEKDPSEWREVNLNGQIKIFKNKIIVEALSSDELGHTNPLKILN